MKVGDLIILQPDFRNKYHSNAMRVYLVKLQGGYFDLYHIGFIRRYQADKLVATFSKNQQKHYTYGVVSKIHGDAFMNPLGYCHQLALEELIKNYKEHKNG